MNKKQSIKTTILGSAMLFFAITGAFFLLAQIENAEPKKTTNKQENSFTSYSKIEEKPNEEDPKILEIQDEVNKLFTKPLFNGEELEKEIILKKDVKNEQIIKIEKTLLTREKDTPFKKKLREVMFIARTQFDDIELAKKLLSEKITTDDTQNAIDKIKNQEVKQELQEQLDLIK